MRRRIDVHLESHIPRPGFGSPTQGGEEEGIDLRHRGPERRHLEESRDLLLDGRGPVHGQDNVPIVVVADVSNLVVGGGGG